MPKKQRSEVTAGIFVILALVVLLGVVFWLGASEIFKPTGQRVVFYASEDAGSLGLLEGGFIQINDANIGKIKAIRYDPATRRTLYLAETDCPEIAIHADGKAHVAAGLVGGGKLVISDRGSEDQPLADMDHPIAITGGLDRAIASLSDSAEKLKIIAGVLAEELADEDADSLLAGIRSIINDLRSSASDLAAITGNVRPEMNAEKPDSILAKLKQTADSAAETTGRIQQYSKEDVAEILTNLRRANTEILKAARNFAELSDQARQMVALNRTNIDEMIDNMTIVSANLKSASKEIRRNPWRLIYRPKPGEMANQNIYDAARAFSSGAEQLDQAIAKLKALPEGVAADAPEVLQIRKQIEATFANFSQAEQALWKELTK